MDLYKYCDNLYKFLFDRGALRQVPAECNLGQLGQVLERNIFPHSPNLKWTYTETETET
jgi:hypothetical protein